KEADNGHDGSWVAHPGLAAIVNDVYGNAFEAGKTNQRHVLREGDAPIMAENLLAPSDGSYTDEGLRDNIRVALQYIEAWLQGAGAVAIYGLMEDAATAEISRASIWQWIRNGATLTNGETMTADYFRKAMAEEIEVVKSEIGVERWSNGRFDEAIELFENLCLQDGFAEFLTLGAYEKL
ncbi:MAG: hypothetical protein MRY59_02170, partial [Aquisalinus sp.]|nr:hypothetical protein [Aquisalinus sp.]